MSEFYETDRAVSEYLLFHYGQDSEALPYGHGPKDALHYPVRCVTEFESAFQLGENARALDLGCAVGRSSFELARHCEEVIGIDYSHRFVQAAEHLRAEGQLRYDFVESGAITRSATAVVPDAISRERVSFEQGDALFLRSGLGEFDVILMANLIDRLVDPAKCIQSLKALVRPGGLVILTSPYTWLEEYTPKEHWLGGQVVDGKPVTTLDALRDLMEPAFGLRDTKDLPFLIREHARKYQWSVAQGTLWRKGS